MKALPKQSKRWDGILKGPWAANHLQLKSLLETGKRALQNPRPSALGIEAFDPPWISPTSKPMTVYTI